MVGIALRSVLLLRALGRISTFNRSPVGERTPSLADGLIEDFAEDLPVSIAVQSLHIFTS
jgi:hypothetical protein